MKEREKHQDCESKRSREEEKERVRVRAKKRNQKLAVICHKNKESKTEKTLIEKTTDQTTNVKQNYTHSLSLVLWTQQRIIDEM